MPTAGGGHLPPGSVCPPSRARARARAWLHRHDIHANTPSWLAGRAGWLAELAELAHFVVFLSALTSFRYYVLRGGSIKRIALMIKRA